jgi:hypothetical protein
MDLDLIVGFIIISFIVAGAFSAGLGVGIALEKCKKE